MMLTKLKFLKDLPKGISCVINYMSLLKFDIVLYFYWNAFESKLCAQFITANFSTMQDWSLNVMNSIHDAAVYD